jgi:hypothetical protein
MFRGEPISLHTLMLGLLSLWLLIIFGMNSTGIISLGVSFSTITHYYLAFYGWIGLLIFGAQLQFFKAIGGLRKYEPEWLRSLFHIFIIISLLSIVTGISTRNFGLYMFGLLVYALVSLIVLFWLNKGYKSPLFKFPLDYFFLAHLFFIFGHLYLLIDVISSQSIPIDNKTVITHIFAAGWISLTLQGALVRIMPMFVGKTIDRELKTSLKAHLTTSVVGSLILTAGFVFSGSISMVFHWIGGILWSIAWVWTLIILFKSVLSKSRQIENKFTLSFFIPGLIFWIIGLTIGLLLPFINDPDVFQLLRRIHIHYTLLFGLMMIMLGAFHRITSFQIYTILYTGRRGEITLASFHHEKVMIGIAIYLVTQVLLYTYGFVINDLIIVGISGSFILLGIAVYTFIILSNYLRYFKDKKNAIPFHLKPSEYDPN